MSEIKEYNFIKEVREQPEAVRRSLEHADNALQEMAHAYAGIERVILTGCGDPYMVGICGQYAFEAWARLPADAIEAAELTLYRHHSVNPKTLIIAMSSSGRSLRVVNAVQLARERGAPHLAIVNVVPSTLADASERTLQTQAGHSNAYPSKTSTTALALLHSLALYLAEARGTLPPAEIAALRAELKAIPDRIAEALQLEEEMKTLAIQHKSAPMFTYVGSGPNLGTAMLTAAKMGETSQSLSRSTNLEEFSHLHGYTILPTEPIFMISRAGAIGEQNRLIAHNIMLNKGKPIVIDSSSEEKSLWEGYCEAFVTIPAHTEMFGPLVAWIPLQMFAYYIGIAKGRNPDRPDRIGSDTIQTIIYGGMLEGYDKR